MYIILRVIKYDGIYICMISYMMIIYEYIRVSGGFHTTSDSEKHKNITVRRIPDFMMGWVSHSSQWWVVYDIVLTTCLIPVRSQWSRYNLPGYNIYMYI